MKKILKWGGIAVVVLVLLVVLFLFFGLNSIIKAGVQRGGEYATGQTTKLDSANLSLMGGTLNLSGLDMGNPVGYKSPQFLSMKSCDVKVESGSVFSSTVVVDSITIDGLVVTLEENGIKSNLMEILAVIKSKTSAGSTGSGDSGGSSTPGKQLKIGVIKLTGTKVHVKAGMDMTMDLGPIEIADPTNPDGRPMKLADVVGKVLIAVAKQITENPQIPGGLKNGLKGFDGLMNNASKDLGGGLKDATKGLGGLFKKP